MHFYKIHMKTSLNEDVKRVIDLNYTSYIISWFFAKLFFFRNIFLKVYRVYHHATLSETSIAIFLLLHNHAMQRTILITEY